MNLHKIMDNLDLQSKGIWFPITFGVIVLLFALFMPKRLSWREFYLTFGLVGWIGWMSDIFIGITLDWFDLGIPNKIGLADIISIGIIPSALSVIFLNYYEEKRKWLYAIGFTALSFAFEWVAVQVGYMKLHGWNTWWSLPVYIFVYGFFLPWHIKLIRKEYGGNGNVDEEFNLNLFKEKAR
ncbi:hypothetical protein [Ammoniphilus sp. 3BR4]|uniref:hypothetical protein n=1 Tax=Ammoniphilus sp. 3BR4 TaxID=3158265 RepID=UPI0034651454